MKKKPATVPAWREGKTAVQLWLSAEELAAVDQAAEIDRRSRTEIILAGGLAHARAIVSKKPNR